MKTDTEIQKNVMDELKWDPILNASEIGVAVKNGIVTLSGTIDSYFKKDEAENAAKRVNGVRAVASDIDVTSPSNSSKTDTEIARVIADTLKYNSAVNEDKIKIKVDNGWVTMEGTVDWEYQKEAVRTAIKNISGVKGMANLIRITPVVTAKDIQQKIAAAFQRHANLDSERILVDVNQNKVTLSGKVRSWIEKNDAENAAWRAPGITSIENRIIVDANALAL
jgi:osmotically-inducible protein OsmY